MIDKPEAQIVKDAGQGGGISPLMKGAVWLNLSGVALLTLSLYVETPFQMTATMVLGSVLAAAGFLVWLKMVIDEALSRGMMD